MDDGGTDSGGGELSGEAPDARGGASDGGRPGNDEGGGGGGGVGVQAADAGICGATADPSVNDSPNFLSSRSVLSTETNAGDPSSGSAVRVIAT